MAGGGSSAALHSSYPAQPRFLSQNHLPQEPTSSSIPLTRLVQMFHDLPNMRKLTGTTPRVQARRSGPRGVGRKAYVDRIGFQVKGD